MISEMAKEDIEAMQREGLKPTFEDIIRLNALGLKVTNFDKCADLCHLPRVSYLGKICFRQPTIGHGMWIDQVERIIAKDDFVSRIAINAYALSRPQDKLPDADQVNVVTQEIQKFCDDELKPFTLAQINCAINYAVYGSDPVTNEFPEYKQNDDSDDIYNEVSESIFVGCMIGTLAMGLGLSVHDIKGMTQSQCDRIRMLGLRKNGFYDAKSEKGSRDIEYYRTLDSIRARLIKEKEENKDGQ